MLFADIEKFTRLTEGELPGLMRALDCVRRHSEAEHRGLCQLETWGDAIYAVHRSAIGLLNYTFAVQHGLDTLDPAAYGLNHPIRLRMGLHAGPVYEDVQPLNGRPVVYGSQVSRAARIEPISVAGHIYASQQFVAMLMSEDNSARHAALSMGESYTRKFICEYMGTLALPKGYGRQAVYHVRRPGTCDT
jgi:class 3 adenylate cyclase